MIRKACAFYDDVPMKIAKLEFFPVSIAYTHREVSSQINRDGVSDVIVKATTDDGLIGWGEACSGANLASVHETLRAMEPFVVGHSPWSSEAIRAELWLKGIWMFRKPTANFAYAGIDMALWDICGKACNQPLYNLFGGKVRESADYFCYLARGTEESITAECEDGVRRGYNVFYLKVGLDIEAEYRMVRALRRAIGPARRIRLDANCAWNVNQALRNLDRLDEFNIDFIEQPVKPDPITNMQEVRSRTRVALSANEGLWSAEEAFRQITSRTADVYCFQNSYWVGTLAQFQRLGQVAALEGLAVCKHSHGEFGIAAAAAHHILLTLPNIVDGNQQTAQIMRDDVLQETLPIAGGPTWGVPEKPGLGVVVSEEKVRYYHEAYRRDGQFIPYDPALL